MKLLKLENRIVLDGAALVAAAQFDAQQSSDPTVVAPATDPVPVPADQQSVADAVVALALEPTVAGADGLDIALVANNLDNYDQLVADLQAQGVSVVVFDTVNDSPDAVLQQVEALSLSESSDIASLSVVSHGGGGRFALGNEMVTADSLSQDSAAWGALSDNFASSSAVYLFGCNVVDGSGQGQALLDSLASLTGTDIFASNDVTGVGGDWILEAASAGADTQLATPDAALLAALSGYEGTLANSAPVINLPGAQSVNEDNTLAITGLSVSDPDITALGQEASRNVQVSLNVQDAAGNPSSNGLLTLNQQTGITFLPPTVGQPSDGIADSNMIFMGSVTDVNAALASLTFAGGLNFNGPLQIEVTVNDLGNADLAIVDPANPNQIGTPISVTQAFAVDIIAVNDAPVNTFPATAAAVEDTPLSFSIAGANPIQISDVDAGTAPVQVTLTTLDPGTGVSNGTVSLNGATGLTFISGTGTGDTTVVIQGTITDINAALDGMSFTANPNFTGNASVSITTNDLNAGAQGLGGQGITGPDTVAIAVSAVNDAPINTVPVSPLSMVEDTPLVFSAANGNAVQVSDVDIGTAPMQVTLTVDSGTLSLAQTTGLTFAVGNGTANSSMTFAGTVADINLALEGMSFTPAVNFNGPVNFSIASNDQNAGAQGVGGALSALDQLVLDVVAVNDAPTVTVPAVQALSEDSPLTFSVAGGNAIQVSDVDAGISPLLVTLSVTNGTVDLSGVAGLNFTVGTGTGNSSMIFTGAQADINLALDGLVFNPTANFTGAAQISLTVNDQNVSAQGTGGALSGSGVADITVSPINDAPVITAPASQTVNEDTGLVFSAANGNAVQVSDADIGTAPMQMTLTATNGTLTLSGVTGLTFATGTGTGDASMVFTGTVADINLALEGMTLTPATNFNGGASLSVVANDQNAGLQGAGGALSASNTVLVTVNPVNDAPVNIVPAAQSVAEDTSLVFSVAGGNPLQVSDVDAGAGPLAVTLAVTNGTLTLAQLTGLTFTAGTGSGDATMIFSGSLTDINAALDGLQFAPTANFNGALQLQMSTDDQGNTGSGGALVTSNAVDITVTAVNDAPQLTLPLAQVVNEDTDLPISGLSISDVDVGTGLMEVTLSSANGVLSLTQSAGLTFLNGSTGNQDASMTFQGTQADINAALAGLIYYRGNPNFNGTDSLDITVSDLGNTGGGGVLTATGAVAITVTAVNDPPSITAPTSVTVAEDTLLPLTGVSVADPDVATGSLEVTLTVGDALTPALGTLTLGVTNNLTISTGTGTNDATLVFRGTLADINAALASLSYQGNLNANGNDLITLAVNDLGNSGSGGALSVQQTIDVQITPVNDAPVLTVPGNAAVTEDLTSLISGISVADVDAGTSTFTVVVSAVNGTPLASAPGVTVASSNGGSTLTLTGQLTDINSALSNLQYQGSPNFNGNEVLTITVSDQSLSDTATIAVTVSPAPDAPIITLGGVASYLEGDPAILLSPAATVSEVDGENITVMTVALSNHQTGDLLAATNLVGGVSTASYDSVTGVLTISAVPGGAIASDFEAALQSVTYVNSQAQIIGGSQTITVEATDTTGLVGQASMLLSLNANFTPTSPPPDGLPGGASPPLAVDNAISMGSLGTIPNSNIGFLGGVNLLNGVTDTAFSLPSNAVAAMGAQNLDAVTFSPVTLCSLDELFKRLNIENCRFAPVPHGLEPQQYLMMASGEAAGWVYPMASGAQGLESQMFVAQPGENGFNTAAPASLSEIYRQGRAPIADLPGVNSLDSLPADQPAMMPSRLPLSGEEVPAEPLPDQPPVSDGELLGSGDVAVDGAAAAFETTPPEAFAPAEEVNITPLAPLSDPDEVMFGDEEGGEGVLMPEVEGDIEILGRSSDQSIGDGSRAS